MTDTLRRDREAQIASLRQMMTWRSKRHITDILLRRIYALEMDIEFTNPFDEVDEVLYRMWR